MVHPSDRVFMTASGHGSGMPMRGTGRRAEQVMRGGETFQLSLLPDRTDLVTRAQSSAKVDLGATAAPRTRPAPTPGPYARSGKKACHGDRKAVTPLNEKGPATLAFHKVGLTGFEPATPCAESSAVPTIQFTPLFRTIRVGCPLWRVEKILEHGARPWRKFFVREELGTELQCRLDG